MGLRSALSTIIFLSPQHLFPSQATLERSWDLFIWTNKVSYQGSLVIACMSFSIPAITDYHNLGGLRQHKLIIP